MRALNTALQTRPSLAGLVGADIATDVRLDSGVLILAFGDSILLPTHSPTRPMVANSLLAISRDRACLALGEDRTAFVPERADGVRYWPMSVMQAQPSPGAIVAVFLQRIRGEDFDELVALGPAVAEVAIDEDGLPRLLRVIDLGPDRPSRANIGWGAAAWVGDDGYAYIFGTANPGTHLAFGWSLHVARVRPGDVFDPAAWEYFTEHGWGRQQRDVATLIEAVGGVSQTLSVFSQSGRWYAVSKQDDFLGDTIAIWQAAAPTGPYADPVPVAYRPSDVASGMLAYAAIAHPTLYPKEGTVVVSVSRNSLDPASIAKDPTAYRPEFLRVPLPAP